MGSGHMMTPPPPHGQTDRQTRLKILPFHKLRVRVVIKEREKIAKRKCCAVNMT